MNISPLSGQETPFFGEILDTIIDFCSHSKLDLCRVALVAKAWTPRARYQLVRRFLSNLHLDSLPAIAGLAQFSNSSMCTILRPTYQSITIPALIENSDATVPSDDLFSFLQKIVVTCSVAVSLDSEALESVTGSFPWSVLATWTTLTDLRLSGSLPSIATLANVIVELPELESINLDVDYLDLSLPPGGRPSPYLRSLSLGPRGYGLLSWLALLEEQCLQIQTLSLKIDRDQLSPFQAFSRCHGSQIEYFTTTFYKNRAADLAPCLQALTEVYEFEFYLNYTASAAGYSPCIQSLTSSVASPPAQALIFYTPPLPGGELEALQLSLLAKDSMNVSGDEEEPCSISVCQRSWMVAY